MSSETRGSDAAIAPHGKRDNSKGLLALIGLQVCFLTLFAGAVALWLFAGATQGISRLFYVLIDFPGFAVFMAAAFGAGVAVVLPPVSKSARHLHLDVVPVWAVAAGSLVLTIPSVQIVYHGYAFSMDEWMTRLQAEIFLSGNVSANVPEQLRELGRAMYQPFASYDPTTGTLASNYRPGMSAIHAVFELVGLGIYSSAFLNAAAILLVARVARQIWPDAPEAPIVAALLLATSQQALAAALTSYAMAGHLCFNLLWLTLFLDDRLRSHVLAALVGVATASLHQVHAHLFFALPFLLGLLKPFRPSLILLYGGIYLVGHLAVLSWDWWSFNRFLETTTAAASSAPSAEVPGILERAWGMARFPSGEAVATVAANLVRMVAWQSLALVPLLALAAPAIRANRLLQLLAWSFALSLLPYPVLMPDQGHGWGYRYLHGLLGNLALLATAGWLALRLKDTHIHFRNWILVLLLFSPMVMLPFRAWQIERLVGPYAEATEIVAKIDTDFVLVNNYKVMIGSDIPRNSPVSPGRPIVLNDLYLTPDMIRRLCATYRVAVPDTDAYATLGLLVREDVHPELAKRWQERQAAVESCSK